MSSVGNIGMLMADSGLEDVMKAAFGGVEKMLTGNNFPQNTRAFRMVTEEILHNVIESVDSYDKLIDALDNHAANSRTAKRWLENLIITMFIMMLFVRTEREAD